VQVIINNEQSNLL